MDWSALLGGVGSIAGSILGSHSAKKAARTQYKYQVKLWNHMQSNAHQLEVQDLRKAGLNPILSATNSQMAPSGNISVQDPVDYSSEIPRFFQSAIRLATEKDLKLKDLEMQEKLAGIRDKEADTNAKLAAIKDYEAKTGRFSALSQFQLNQSQIAFNAVRSKLSEKEIKKVEQDISNSIRITDAQVESLKGNAAASYAAAGKFGAEAEEALVRAGVARIQARQLSANLENGAFLTYYLGVDKAAAAKDDPVGFLLKMAAKQKTNVENHSKNGFFDISISKNPDWLKNLIGR